MIGCIWIVALTSTIPWALFFQLVPLYADSEILLCREIWPYGLDGSLYFLVANVFACYLVPMLLISLCYILIWIKVSKRSIPGDSKDAQMDRMQQKSKIKVVKMLIAVVILFVLSWLPLYLIFARIKFGKFHINAQKSNANTKIDLFVCFVFLHANRKSGNDQFRRGIFTDCNANCPMVRRK